LSLKIKPVLVKLLNRTGLNDYTPSSFKYWPVLVFKYTFTLGKNALIDMPNTK